MPDESQTEHLMIDINIAKVFFQISRHNSKTSMITLFHLSEYKHSI